MQNKLVKELRMLAKSIFLDLDDHTDYKQIKNDVGRLYEKLIVLNALDDFRNDIEAKQQENDQIEILNNSTLKVKEPFQNKNENLKKSEDNSTQVKASIKQISFEEEKPLVHDFDLKKPIASSSEETLDEPKQHHDQEKEDTPIEFKDEIPIDEAANLFEKAAKQEDFKTSPSSFSVDNSLKKQRISVNDTLLRDHIQIGLNDRIAFVKHLFEGSQQEFIRVLSQLNTFSKASEAKKFLNEVVKPDYDWSNKEIYEQRLSDFIEKKFT